MNDKQQDTKTPLLKIALVSIISNFAFLVLLSLIVYTVVCLFNLRVAVGRLVIRQGGSSNISLIKTEAQKSAEEFNNSQWATYSNMWKATQPKISKIQNCRDKMQELVDKYNFARKDYLKAEISNIWTREIYVNNGIYGRSNEIVQNLDRIINMYHLSEDKPEFIPEIYIGSDYENQTKDSASTRLRQIESDFTKVSNFSDNLQCVDVDKVSFENIKGSCEAMGNLQYEIINITEPVYLEEGEIPEQLELRQKERNDYKVDWIQECYEE
jgi:hypothetical protein